jgi:hypothetical protein
VSIENKLKISVSGFLSGIGAALICYYVARDNNSPLMFSIAYAGFIFHLMALMPISHLDGYYASQNLSHNLWLIGIPLMLMAYYIIPNPWLLIITVFGSIQLIHYYLKPDKNPTNSIPLEIQLQYIALYLGMIIFLSFMSYSLYDMFQKHILP